MMSRKIVKQYMDSELETIFNKENPTNKDLLMFLVANNQTLNNLTSKVNCIASDNISMKERLDKTEEAIHDSSTEISNLKTQIQIMQQKELDTDIVITGVPLSIISESRSTTTKISSQIPKLQNAMDNILPIFHQKYNLKKSDIRHNYQTVINTKYGTPNGDQNENKSILLVISLNSSAIKSSFMAAVRTGGPLFVKEVFPNFSNSEKRIHINDRLTVNNVKIRNSLLQLRKQNLIDKFWLQNNKFYVRVSKTDNKSSIIQSNDDVQQLTENLQSSSQSVTSKSPIREMSPNSQTSTEDHHTDEDE